MLLLPAKTNARAKLSLNVSKGAEWNDLQVAEELNCGNYTVQILKLLGRGISAKRRDSLYQIFPGVILW